MVRQLDDADTDSAFLPNVGSIPIISTHLLTTNDKEMKQLVIRNIKGTRGLCDKHRIKPDTPYEIIYQSESGKFLYIGNPLWQGKEDLRNASWIAVAKDECIILN